MSYPRQQPPAPPHLPGPRMPPPPVRKGRSFIWLVLIALAGWAMFAVPALWLFFSAAMNLSLAPGRPATGGYVAFSLVSVLCMLSSPILLGCATTFRLKSLWIIGIITVIPALVGAAIIYLDPYF